MGSLLAAAKQKHTVTSYHRVLVVLMMPLCCITKITIGTVPSVLINQTQRRFN